MNTGSILVGDHNIITGREYCSAYTDSFGRWNPGFYCPQSESKAAISCCGTPTFKYCCDTTRGGNGNGNGGRNSHGIDTSNEQGSSGGPTSSSTSHAAGGTAGSNESGGESLNIPFLVRFPILSGVVTGFLLVTIFVVIGSCYSHSCCIFSKRSYLSSGLLYQIVVRKSAAAASASSSSSGAGSRGRGGGRSGGRGRTRPIQSIVVCTAESQLPAIPFVHQQQHQEMDHQQQQPSLPLLPYGTDKSTDTSTLLLSEPTGKPMIGSTATIANSTSPVIVQNSNFSHPLSDGQSPIDSHPHPHQQQQQTTTIQGQQQQQHQSSAAAASAHNFQHITQALENGVPLLPPSQGAGASSRVSSSSSSAAGAAATTVVQLSRTNSNSINSDSPKTVNMCGSGQQQQQQLTPSTLPPRNMNAPGPELLLHCPSETPRSRPSSQNSNGRNCNYAARNSYAYSTLPNLRGRNGGYGRIINTNSYSSYYTNNYERCSMPPPPMYTAAMAASMTKGDSYDQECMEYGYGPANIKPRPYSTLNLTRPRSNPSPNQLYSVELGGPIEFRGHGAHGGHGGLLNGGGPRSSSSNSTHHKSILKKPSSSSGGGYGPLPPPGGPRYYISAQGSSQSAPEDDDDDDDEDDEPDYYYVKKKRHVSSTPPDIIQTRQHSISSSYSSQGNGNGSACQAPLPLPMRETRDSHGVVHHHNHHIPMQMQPQVLNYATTTGTQQQQQQQSRSVQVQLPQVTSTGQQASQQPQQSSVVIVQQQQHNKPQQQQSQSLAPVAAAATVSLELEDQHSEMSEIENDTFL